MDEFVQHWKILVPVFTIVFSGGAAWAGYMFAFKSHAQMLAELKLAIAELRAETKEMSKTHREDMAKFVATVDCTQDRLCCKDDRIAFRGGLTKQVDELLSMIKFQDQKRHESNNSLSKVWAEILERITIVETILQERRDVGSQDRRRPTYIPPLIEKNNGGY